MTDNNYQPFPLRFPCKNPSCNGNTNGVIVPKSGQDIVRCSICLAYDHAASRQDTGRAVRTVKTVHEAINLKLRCQVLLRANRQCELCGKSDDNAVMHVGHAISVKAGIDNGMSESEINNPENLVCLCDECNLGMGDEPIPLRFMLRVVTARVRRKLGRDSDGAN